MSRRRSIALMMGTAGLRADYQGFVRAGVERRCVEYDIDLWVYSGRNDWRTSPSDGQIYELVTRENVDAIILLAGVIACFLDVNELCDRLRKACPVPICSIGLPIAGVPSITIDNRAGLENVVAHLAIAHGRKHFGFIAGPMGHVESDERLAAAREALERVGRSLPRDAVAYGNFSLESGTVQTRELLARLPKLDAIVTANDDMAAGALQALSALQRDCPADLAVVGFDDALSSRICIPSLTTVRQPAFELGVRATDTILAMWQGNDSDAHTILRTEAVFRESCGCDPLAGPLPTATDQVGLTVEALRAELTVLLNGLFGDELLRAKWAIELLDAVSAEASGQVGALRIAIQRLLDEVTYPDAPIYDLLRVLAFIRKSWSSRVELAALNEVFHNAQFQIGQAMHRREARRRLQDGFLMHELRLSWERLATTLSFEALREVLLRDLPRFSVHNAVVSVYEPGSLERLVPLACLVDGLPVDLGMEPYRAPLVKPVDVPIARTRCSYAIMPLTFELESLGVAMLELPVQEAYMVLREQIGSAIKTVRLHQTLMQQQERLKQQAQLEQQAVTERLRALGLIAGGVAHDLNNVLGPLVALPEAMQRDLANSARDVPETVLADLDTLKDASQRAAHTIRDLLTLGRAVDAPKHTYELNELLRSIRRPLTQIAERATGLVLRLEEAASPLMVNVSREHLVRAISNLVTNATDATETSGEIVVRIREHVVERRLEGIEPVEVGHYAVVEVEDSGRGIPQEDLRRVLEPFFSTKTQTNGGGTGLGLAIVQQIASQCRGYVHVESELGKGSTFALYLPCIVQGRPSTRVAAAPTVGGDESILVVDDERVQLRTAQRILGQLGYRVTVADSGTRALALFDEQARAPSGAPYHLVILDMLMPGLNGLGTLKELRKRNPAQRVLMASGYAPEQLNREATENGVDWLAKPYTTSGLAHAVRRALGDASIEANEARVESNPPAVF